MHARFYRKPIFLIVTTGVVMLVVGLAVGLAFGSGRGATHATPATGFIDIYNSTDLYACVLPPMPAAFGCIPASYPPPLSNVCHTGGNTDVIACEFQAAPHAGQTIRQESFEPCFNFTSQGVVAASNAEIVYKPSGEVDLSCTFLP